MTPLLPNQVANNSDVHMIIVDDITYILSSIFTYDNYGRPIVPEQNFIWIDTNGVIHQINDREGMPPLLSISPNGNYEYLW